MKFDFFKRLTAGLIALGLVVSSCDRKPAAAAASTHRDIRRDATVEAVEKVIPSVVNIATSSPGFEKRRRYIGPFSVEYDSPTGEKLNTIGSGIILEQVGDEVYILTNFHVVSDSKQNQVPRIHVQLSNGNVYEAQRLVWTTQKDLALLKIKVEPGQKFKGVRFAMDDDLLLGETVIAVGNAFGFGASVSRGILSSKNRRTESGNSQLSFNDWLQTDADINPGNSGGPLINLHGEVIGMNVALYEDDEKKGPGLRFAIPVKQISSALSEFFSLEFSSDLWIGAMFTGTRMPLTVRYVQRGGPADRAGLKPGQEILEFNGQPVTGLVNFNSLVAGSPNRRAQFTLSDNGRRRESEVTLIPMVELLRDRLQAQLGMKTERIATNNAPGLLLGTGEGLIVTKVETNSPAFAAGVKAGLVLVGVEGEDVKIGSLARATQSLGKKKPGELVTVSFLVPQVVNGNTVGYQTATATLQAR